MKTIGFPDPFITINDDGITWQWWGVTKGVTLTFAEELIDQSPSVERWTITRTEGPNIDTDLYTTFDSSFRAVENALVWCFGDPRER